MASPPQSSHTTAWAPRTPSPRSSRPTLSREGTRTRLTPSQRLPPPTLFQGPPSRNASTISLALPGESLKDHPDGRGAASARPSLGSPAAAAPFAEGSLRQPPTQADDFHAESLWAEMQHTLADVQLTAMSSSHVFGAEHAKALEDLRTAQLSLAQAWAKSQADEIVDNDLDDDDADNVVSAGLTAGLTASVKDAGPGARTVEAAVAQSSENLEEETERDIRRARKRKEANDRYFKQVNQGVLEVVSRLDGVAGAMRRVQKKSRDLWEHDSTDTDASVDTESGDELDSRSPDSPSSAEHATTVKGK
ncbi:hypothetical protein DV737_g3888, partial [Chaetothyriales sp. CBS 132003]